MPSLSPIEIAREYTERGWRVVPVPYRTKRPVIDGWQNLHIQADDLTAHFNCKPMNIGVLLGQPSGGLVDIDLDCAEAIKLAHLFLPETEAIFGRKTKLKSHWLYNVTGILPATTRLKDVKDSNGKQATLVEFRSTGGQTVFPGSTHESGEPIEWETDTIYSADGANLLAAMKSLAAASILARHWPGSGARHEARLALAGGLERAGWAEVDVKHFLNAIESIVPHIAGDAMKNGAGAAKTTARRIAAKGFATGWPTLAKAIGDDVVRLVKDWLDIAPDIEPVEEAVDETAKPFPKHLLHPPGKVGSIVAWINETAYKPQPIFALANALVFWGVVVGRKVACDRIRTGLYALGVGKSGCGKEHSRQAIKTIVNATGAHDLLGGEDIASDTALFKSVARSKSVLFQIDEIGHFFSGLSSKYSGQHQKAIAPAFTKLFSNSNSMMKAKEFAGGDPIMIDQPNVGLYGTTVPGRLYGGLTPDEVRDGFLARMLVFRTHDPDPMETDATMYDPPEDVVESILAWIRRTDLPRARGNVAAEIQHKPIQVPIDEDAASEFKQLEHFARKQKTLFDDDSGLDAVWARAAEHARRVALVIASGCAFEPGDLRVTGDVACYACELVRYLTDDFVNEIKWGIAGSDAERDIQTIVRAIKGAGRGGITRTDLLRQTQRIRKQQREEAISFLIESYQVGQRDESSTGGRKKTIYFLAKRSA